ncbi:nickel ABC transporter permease [Paenibacillus sp. JJ-223]|uniref:nickel ABC transporter permease n=1 Tax=Paenibacillus sp. JJ-223 TaxID=2905647 RepID=UPI001F258239|nr:nickel ABC transporter permease [Paenibacillus sp. JJ-223]CAH1201305.1 Nickel transport system permease protein NikB [Paenibacillus sp. JJ-223]
MLKWIGRRLTQLVIVLFVLSIVVFVLMKLAPGDPVMSLLRADEMQATRAQAEALREELGFNRPLAVQYWSWMTNVMTLDFGDSLLKNKPVLDELLDRLPATLQLAMGGITVMVLISVPLGLLAARFPGRLPDHFGKMFALLGASMPTFWIGLILIYLFSTKMHWLPTMGKGEFKHLVLPSITLGFGLAAVHTQLLKTGMLESLSTEYVRSARARGIGEFKIVLQYALRAACIPVLTVFGMTFGSLIAGSVVVETLFSWPGLGSMAVEAIFQRDYPLIQGYLMMTGAFTILVNLLVDLLYGWIDPRIRLRKGGVSS